MFRLVSMLSYIAKTRNNRGILYTFVLYSANLNLICQLRLILCALYSDLIYNTWNEGLYCHENCCPFNIEEIEQCSGYRDCYLDCGLLDGGCDGRIIDARDKRSLTVDCNEYEDNTGAKCRGMQVLCPVTGSCTVNCNSYFGCSSMNVSQEDYEPGILIGDFYAQVIVNCIASSSCRDINITAINADSLIINSSDYYALYNADVHAENVSNFHMACHHSIDISCYNTVLYFGKSMPENTEIECYGRGISILFVLLYIIIFSCIF